MTYRRSPHTAWRTIGDEHIVVDLRGLRMYGLNDSGAFVWHRLDGAVESLSLATQLRQRQAEITTQQIEQFCEQLAGLGLAEPAETTDEIVATRETKAPPIAHGASPAPPEILWQEAVQQPSGSCAFLPAQNPLCNTQSFS